MSDVTQSLEDLVVSLTAYQGKIQKLNTASVSGRVLRKEAKDLHKVWLPLSGALETSNAVDTAHVAAANAEWARLLKLAEGKNPKAQYKTTLKMLVKVIEVSILHALIKHSGLETIGTALRVLIKPISDIDLLKYLDESIRCAEADCIRGAGVLAWCAVAFKVHQKLLTLGLPRLESEFDKLRLDTGLMFKGFNRAYKLSTPLDIQEIPDAHLILLCRFLTWLDDTQYKQLKAALDTRNGCGHPTGYAPDPAKLRAYYADILQLVLLNPKFA